jgi:hypothetical protein
MASTDWTKPEKTDNHLDILSEIKGRDVDAIKMIDDETPTRLVRKCQ